MTKDQLSERIAEALYVHLSKSIPLHEPNTEIYQKEAEKEADTYAPIAAEAVRALLREQPEALGLSPKTHVLTGVFAQPTSFLGSPLYALPEQKEQE